MSKNLIFGLISLVLLGCGSEGTSCINCTNPDDINLTKDIQNGKISGYHSSDPIDIQYLSIINYFRSLDIKCDDPQAIQGPSGSNLVWDDNLKDSTKEHSEDMMKSNWYSHDGSGTLNDKTAVDLNLGRGSKFYERISHNGFSGSTTAENIARIETKPNIPASDAWIGAMEGWIKSKHGHCSNIMNPNLKYFGMYESRTTSADSNGYYKAYWTQDFGSD